MTCGFGIRCLGIAIVGLKRLTIVDVINGYYIYIWDIWGRYIREICRVHRVIYCRDCGCRAWHLGPARPRLG